jgi:hypothetical protein
MARISRAGTVEGCRLSRNWIDQRIDVGGLSLSGLAFRRLQCGYACLVRCDLFHDHGRERQR